jgi:hypothetical protein
MLRSAGSRGRRDHREGGSRSLPLNSWTLTIAKDMAAFFSKPLAKSQDLWTLPQCCTPVFTKTYDIVGGMCEFKRRGEGEVDPQTSERERNISGSDPPQKSREATTQPKARTNSPTTIEHNTLPQKQKQRWASSRPTPSSAPSPSSTSAPPTSSSPRRASSSTRM